MSYKNLKNLIIKSFKKFGADNASSLGASLAYYTVFSLAPLLIIIVAVAGLVFNQSTVREKVISESQNLYGAQGASYLRDLIASTDKPKTNVLAAGIGVVTLLLGATGVFDSLKNSLDIIWEAPKPKKQKWWKMLTDKILLFGMVLAVGFVLIVSLIASTVVSAAGTYASRWLGAAWVLSVVDIIVSLGIMSLVFGLIYRFLPSRQLLWKECLGGGVITSILFVLGKYLLGLYLGSGSVGSAYGAAGSFVLILVWCYYSAQIFYFGAELVYNYATEYGSLNKK